MKERAYQLLFSILGISRGKQEHSFPSSQVHRVANPGQERPSPRLPVWRKSTSIWVHPPGIVDGEGTHSKRQGYNQRKTEQEVLRRVEVAIWKKRRDGTFHYQFLDWPNSIIFIYMNEESVAHHDWNLLDSTSFYSWFQSAAAGTENKENLFDQTCRRLFIVRFFGLVLKAGQLLKEREMYQSLSGVRR